LFGMNGIRIAITLFILLLFAASIAGWLWTGNHQTPAQSAASRIVLAIGMAAGMVGLAAIWRHPDGTR
jgi:hypothetical protein